jgi:hypothetical protein
MVIVKLRTMVLLVLSDDSELHKYLKCDHSLRRTEGPSYVLGYRYRCKDKLCSGIVDPAENTRFSGLRVTEKEPNPLLRSIKLCYSLLCGICVDKRLSSTQNLTEDLSASSIHI